ncbi:hypothetical protein LY76DRAFT_377077 [Colletotrichum caudatum]|nr:hypothetical protein LY76DRAFT_377077 [Colletotrichum caudatum]
MDGLCPRPIRSGQRPRRFARNDLPFPTPHPPPEASSRNQPPPSHPFALSGIVVQSCSPVSDTSPPCPASLMFSRTVFVLHLPPVLGRARAPSLAFKVFLSLTCRAICRLSTAAAAAAAAVNPPPRSPPERKMPFERRRPPTFSNQRQLCLQQRPHRSIASFQTNKPPKSFLIGIVIYLDMAGCPRDLPRICMHILR